MRHLYIILIVFVLTACGKQRLDDFLFNPDTDISEYLLDDYEGESEIQPGAEYDIASNMSYIFSLVSSSALTPRTYMIYIGDTSQIATDTVILYCHGNAGHMDRYWPRAKLLANIGEKHRYGVLMMDYPGYGLSEGDPTEEGMYQSVDLAMKWLKSRGLTNDRLVIYGYSLGSAPACELTSTPRSMEPSWLITEAPFASAEVMVQDAALLAMPSSYFVNVEVDNAEEIKNVNAPFMWIHGTDDAFLSIETHGEVVWGNYNGSRGEAHRIAGGVHTDVPAVFGYPQYLQALEDFITNQ